jgi:phospholipase C
MDRRTFIKAAAAAGLGAAALSTQPVSAASGPVNLALPSLRSGRRRGGTPVEHIVVLMQENRSIDHYLGWYGAENDRYDAHQHAAFPDLRQGPDGPLVETELWGAEGRNDYAGRGFRDPSHGWTGGRLERNGGACDGWLDPGTRNDEFALSYYDAADIPVWAQLTRGWQTYDRWFCALLAPTQPNRYYMHSAQSAGLKNNALPPELAAEHPEWANGWDWATIWTLLEQAGVSCAYYFSNLPEIALWGNRHAHLARRVADFYADCAAGTLPQVSFVDPWFIGPEGMANDDHPFADIRLGQAFISDVVEAFTSSSHYRRGALVITYDEWGGFFDHVDPPQLRDDRATPDDPGGDNDFGQVGFRIPSTIVSPWTARPGTVDHHVYEHTSVLRFISENWDLPYLTTRHESTRSIGKAFRKFKRYDPEPEFTPYEFAAQTVVAPSAAELLQAPATGDLHHLAESGFLDGLGFNLDQRLEDSFLSPRSVGRVLAFQR